MEYLIIDGYNVINSWKEIFDLNNKSLEDSRDKLLNILSNFQGYKSINLIIVFDAYLVNGSQEKQESFDNITVVYTKENETADNFIEKFVHKYGRIHTIRVVTSDYLEQTIILSKGGIRMHPRELREEISQINKTGLDVMNGTYHNDNSIASNVKPELRERLENIRRGKS